MIPLLQVQPVARRAPTGERTRLASWLRIPGALLAITLLAGTAAAAPGQPIAHRSFLDRLPRPHQGQWRAAWKAARARGGAGLADAAWIETFYGDAAARKQASHDLKAALQRDPNDVEAVFTRFVLERIEGQQQQEMRSALQLLRIAPNDVGSELAAREISGILEGQGRLLLDAAPELRQLLSNSLRDPATAYMLGQPLLALVQAPGVSLSRKQAVALAGRPRWWTLFGPFGRWRNLDFDRHFAIERRVAASYSSSSGQVTGYRFDASPGVVHFPEAWDRRGVEYAETFVHVAVPTSLTLRAYSAASFILWINGVQVARNDRRAHYGSAAITAAVQLQQGWNRILLKLGGMADRDFTLALHGAAGAGAVMQDAATPAAGAPLAGAPRILPEPETLARWAQQRLAQRPSDAVALWVDARRRADDGDGETARAELQQAAKIAPDSTAVWLDLAKVYTSLPDASETWAAGQSEMAARKALQTDPAALPGHDQLGSILESEGKLTEAGQEYALCTGRGYADCDWSDFRLAARRHWLPEARQALAHALAISPSDWNASREGLSFYTQIGDAVAATQLEAKLRRDPRAHAALGDFFLRHGRPGEAAPLLQAAADFDPSSPLLRREYVEALLRSGKAAVAEKAAQQAQRDFPDDWRVAQIAGEATLYRSRSAAIAQFRATDYNRNLLRHEADFLAGDQFWAPWYHSAAAVIKSAPGKAEYPNATSILVLDQMVDRINPDSTRDSYIHQVFRVLNAAGIESHGTVKIPAGSDLLTVRTIKQDGTILLPEIRANIGSITMPGLEPGDFVETEYVMHEAPSHVVPGTLDNDMFFVFNSSREPYHYSDYIVLAPKNYPLMIDTERFPSPAKVSEKAGWVAREWLVQKTRILGVEPNMPPEQELVPRVWISGKLSWDDIGDYLADASFGVHRATAEMQAMARNLARQEPIGKPIAQANKIFAWVVANIHAEQGSALAPAARYFEDRSGSRLATFLGLLSAAHIPFQFAVARPVTSRSSLKIPNLATFPYPLVRVTGAGGATTWFDLNNDFARQGYINPAFRGGLALLTGSHGTNPFVTVPQATSTLDGMITTAKITVGGNGAANLHLMLEFRGPLGERLRQSLASVPESQLPQVYQQIALRSYPNATASGGRIEGLKQHERPLSISVDASVPNFVRREGARWEIDHPIGSVGLLARYAQLPARVHPLVITGDGYEKTEVQIRLPPQFTAARLPRNMKLSNQFGSYDATNRASSHMLDLDRTVYLKANYITPNAYEKFRQFGEAVDNQERLPIMGEVQQ